MIKLSNIIKENEEEIQLYIDILSMNPNSASSQKYKNILKTKYGIDYDKQYAENDSDLIKNASLDNIKSKDDFLNFDNYRKYAKEIFKLRKLASKQPTYVDIEIPFSEVEELGKKLGFKVKERPYSGVGNYAQVSTNVLEVPNPVDINTLLHELGHVYHYLHYGDGISSTITNASSPYGIGLTDEVFAENFLHYWISPNFLRNNIKHVFIDLHSKIKSNWKSEIKKMFNRHLK